MFLDLINLNSLLSAKSIVVAMVTLGAIRKEIPIGKQIYFLIVSI